eukprot:9639215-Alexandrium_andersonii.AAC.1
MAEDTLRDYCEVRNKEKIEKAARNTLGWLEGQSAEKNEYEARGSALQTCSKQAFRHRLVA